MSHARAIVVPFQVPPEAKGIGFGLAALVHAFGELSGGPILLAQLTPRDATNADAELNAPVETIMAPSAWHEMTSIMDRPLGVDFVLTGVIHPPGHSDADERGVIHLLLFDARNGAILGQSEVHFDSDDAGRSIVSAFDTVFERVSATLGNARSISELSWETLESVLHAERFAFAQDRLIAIAHLERAIDDSPESQFAVNRLSSIAFDVAGTAAPQDVRVIESALRAVERAASDAHSRNDLREAMSALHFRLGRSIEAEVHAILAVNDSPERSLPRVLLSQVRRARGDIEGALQAVSSVPVSLLSDATFLNERGIVLAEKGDFVGAHHLWLDAFSRDSKQVPTYMNLASLALKLSDTSTAQMLVDHALKVTDPPADILRRAIQIALATEPDGLSRTVRTSALARALLARVPNDPWGSIIVAQALIRFGETRSGMEWLSRILQSSPGTTFAAEAMRGKFSIEHPQVGAEMEALMRDARQLPLTRIDAIFSRARDLAEEYGTWMAWLAVGIIEKRFAQWDAAREALERAINCAPGCTPAHVELSSVCLEMGDSQAALAHARKAVMLEGDTAETSSLIAKAQQIRSN